MHKLCLSPLTAILKFRVGLCAYEPQRNVNKEKSMEWDIFSASPHFTLQQGRVL
jgi:hypothetical protein